MTRLQKRILAIIGFLSLFLLGVALCTVFAFGLLAFFYHDANDLHWAIADAVSIPLLFTIVSFSLGTLKRI